MLSAFLPPCKIAFLENRVYSRRKTYIWGMRTRRSWRPREFLIAHRRLGACKTSIKRVWRFAQPLRLQCTETFPEHMRLSGVWSQKLGPFLLESGWQSLAFLHATRPRHALRP